MNSALEMLTSPRLSRRDSVALSSSKDPYAINEPKDQRIDDVRIVPGKLIFKDAYDGKSFNQSFSVINCGKRSAFVRILAPSSNAFKMKPIPRGQMLSAGMSITRNISYTHTSAMALLQATILVDINETRVVYPIEVLLNAPFVILKPKVVNFGEIDVGTLSKKRCISLYNRGHKVTQFIIDVGRADMALVIQPMKGTIDPSSTVEIYLEVLGYKLGAFYKEFWIKTEPLQRVKLCGTFIQPRLTVEHPLSTFNLTLVDFPKMYYGAKITRTVVIKNNSSTPTMFCLVLETDGHFNVDKTDFCNETLAISSSLNANTKFHCISGEMKKHIDLNSFLIKPIEGRLGAKQQYILQLSFVPKKSKKGDRNSYKNYRMVFLRIINVQYRDRIVDDDKLNTYRETADSDQYSSDILPTYQSPVASEHSPVEDYLRLCLYGETEEASVKLIPDSFTISYLKVNETYSYELTIKNMSKHLPIVCNYNKVACVEVEPKRMLLQPQGSAEVVLAIRPTRMGPTQVTVTFNLVYEVAQERCDVGKACLPIRYFSALTCPAKRPRFNMGITPDITNEVGFLVDDVRFNTPVDKPAQAIISKHLKVFNKDNEDLIAFPNDRPKCLRPWKNKVPCRTIYTKLPRLVNRPDEQVLNVQLEKKRAVNQVYIDYIRSSAKRRNRRMFLLSPLLHYDVRKENHVLMEGRYFWDYSTQHSTSKLVTSPFVALCPEKLMKIKITPKYVDLGQVASYTTSTESFNIRNDNEFKINVSVKAFSNAIVIKGKERIVIGPKTTKQIDFECWGHGIGKYYVPVFIIVNESHVFDATVFATVVPKTVICPVDEIIIKANESYYFKLYNPVNCPITFCWEAEDPNFQIIPSSGQIQPRKYLYCRVVFHPRENAVYRSEVFLTSQSGTKQIIIVSCENARAQIGFNVNVLTFEGIPLNMPVNRELILRNFSEMRTSFVILNPQPLNEIAVTPTSGEIAPKSDFYFTVTAHFKDIVAFTCPLNFLLQSEYLYSVTVEGNVVYPAIYVEPEYIQIYRTVAGAYQRRVFRITNMSQAPCTVDFRLEDFPELLIADEEKRTIDEISLEPCESKNMFLQFRPTEPVVYSIYLPYVVNGIIGPPALNDPASINPTTYFSSTSDENKEVLKIPDYLPTVGIRCAAGEAWVKFSSLYMNFFCLDDEAKLLTAKNVCTVEHQLALPLVDPDGPFMFKVKNSANVKVTRKYFKVSMKPNDEVIFEITFSPTKYGSYEMEIPIFVDKETESSPLNYLKLSGTYREPTIVCNKTILYFQSIPVEEQVSSMIDVDYLDHKENCVNDAEVYHDALSVVLQNKSTMSVHSVKMNAIIVFNPKEECYVDSEVRLKCSCGAIYDMTVRASACNSKFDCYETNIRREAEELSLEFNSTFPYFPLREDLSFYSVRMRMVKRSLEEVLYTQRFFCNHYGHIPQGVNTISPDIYPYGKERQKGERPQQKILPLVQLLINLISSDIVKCISDSTVTPVFEGINGTIYMYTTYRNIVDYLKNYHVFVAQLQPEYLLPYHMYVMYKTKIKQETEDLHTSFKCIMPEQAFYQFSTQCWIDLLLRIHKIFVFDRIVGLTDIRHKKVSRKYDVHNKDFMKYYSENMTDCCGLYHNEVKLLMWFEFHFERQKATLWDLEAYPHLKQRCNFRCGQNNIWNGLGVATLVAAYCPYLKEELGMFYPNVEVKEHMFHNMCLIQEVVKKLRLKYTLLTRNFLNPTSTEMVLSLSYLYDVLPGFYPKETITLYTALGQEAVNEITLRNSDNAPICYTPMFFSNESDAFSVNSGSVAVPPKKQRTLRVLYQARSVLKKTAVLVLSGESCGYRPARSIAFSLVGLPNIFDTAKEFKFTVEMFRLIKKRVRISSPFQKEYTAKLAFYLGDHGVVPRSTEDFMPTSFMSEQSIPTELSIDSECHFNDAGETTLRMALCYVRPGDFTYFVYFLNEEVGDFSVMLKVSVHVNKKICVDLDVTLPVYFSPILTCTCNKQESNYCKCENVRYECTKLIIIDIPYKNDLLVDALRLLLKTSVKKDEYKFWEGTLDCPKGFHILRDYLRCSFDESLLPFLGVLSPTVTYKVQFSKSKVSFPKQITFDNVTAEGSFKFPIHWNSGEFPEREFLTLTADNKQEIRHYRLNFSGCENNTPRLSCFK